jgi:uncharacterized protein
VKKKPRKTKKRKKVLSNSTAILLLIVLACCCAAIWFITKDSDKHIKKAPIEAKQLTSSDISSQIESACRKLSINAIKLKSKKKDKTVRYSVPIDKTVMDLTYANYLIKDELAKHGTKMISGRMIHGKHILDFNSQTEQAELTLFYDEKETDGSTGKQIAIVVDDFGSIGGDLLDGYLSLPKEVTFAIYPYLPNSVYTMNAAYKQGRETIAHIPMEPLDYPKTDPGKNPILVQMKQSEVEKTLNKALNSLPRCIGISNHLGNLATTDPSIMGFVMNVLKEKNKIFLDDHTSNVSVAYQTAQKAHIKAFQNDTFLDTPDISAETLIKKIDQLETLSLSKKGMIVVSHCLTKEKLVYLQSFIARILEKGFTLVPLSKIGAQDLPQLR